MIFQRLNFLKLLLYRRFHKHVFKMNQAYLRHLEEEKRFELTFQYTNSAFKVDRRFNFCRQVSETVNTFTQRVATNVEKIINKKTKNQEQKVQVTVLVNGEEIIDASTLCGDIFENSKDVVLKVCNNEYQVIINSPWVSAIALPSSILAGFPVYPFKFESMYTDKHLSEFNWFKSSNKTKWDLVGTRFIYNTNNNDIGNFLKLVCVPKNKKHEGPAIETISNVQVEAGPGFCPFETRHKFTNFKCSGDTFRIVSYNILADLYCDSDFTREVLHPYCPPYALQIDYRKQLFIKEITAYKSDIICLQEVDKKIFNYDLQPIFELLNYDSDFCQKRDLVAEGVACFFDKSRFRKLESFRYVLSEELSTNEIFADIFKVIEKNPQLSERILNRSSVLQVNVLESLDDENEVLVIGNTHLYFHPDADHIRLLQGFIVISLVKNIVANYKKLSQKRVSLILCGDFNSVPSCGIYQLYTNGEIPEDHIDFQSKPEEGIKVALTQPTRLKSACGTPKYTNFTAGFADCLDYIYHCDNLEVSQVVPLPSLEELTQHTALPSIVFPSDHIALISDLRFIHKEDV